MYPPPVADAGQGTPGIYAQQGMATGQGNYPARDPFWGAVGQSGIRPGYSDRIQHPAIRAALKKNNKAAGVFGVLLVLAPIVVTFFMSLQSGESETLGIGFIISGIFLAFNLVSSLKKKSERQWDGVVVDKRIEERRNREGTTETFYVVKIQKDGGRVKSEDERAFHHPLFDYLQVGDRVRYHPQFNCFYEKFDKSRDTAVPCPICGSNNDITRDVCGRCGVPVIK